MSDQPLSANHPLSPGGQIPSDYQPVTPDDANDLASAGRCFGLRVTGAGNIVVYMDGRTNNARTIAVVANETIYGAFSRVLATGTTATGLHAMVIPR